MNLVWHSYIAMRIRCLQSSIARTNKCLSLSTFVHFMILHGHYKKRPQHLRLSNSSCMWLCLKKRAYYFVAKTLYANNAWIWLVWVIWTSVKALKEPRIMGVIRYGWIHSSIFTSYWVQHCIHYWRRGDMIFITRFESWYWMEKIDREGAICDNKILDDTMYLDYKLKRIWYYLPL